MKVSPRIVSTGARRALSLDPGKSHQAMSLPQRNFIDYATVGHVDELTGAPEPTPQFVRIEQGQILVEVTIQPRGDQIIARLALPDADLDAGWYVPLTFGARVLVEFVNGNPQNAVIIGRLYDQGNAMPATVCEVQTGAAVANAPRVTVPAPAWQFIKAGTGELLAIETKVNGDILIHSGASVEIKAAETGAIHLNGRVALGEPPTTPPVGQTVGPAGTLIPGVPAIASIPIPKGPTEPVPPATIVPFVGAEDSIIRAKDMVQSHAGVDPSFWTFLLAVAANPIIAAGLAGVPVPIAIHSEHSGQGGPGSKHTASD